MMIRRAIQVWRNRQNLEYLAQRCNGWKDFQMSLLLVVALLVFCVAIGIVVKLTESWSNYEIIFFAFLACVFTAMFATPWKK